MNSAEPMNPAEQEGARQSADKESSAQDIAFSHLRTRDVSLTFDSLPERTSKKLVKILEILAIVRYSIFDMNNKIIDVYQVTYLNIPNSPLEDEIIEALQAEVDVHILADPDYVKLEKVNEYLKLIGYHLDTNI